MCDKKKRAPNFTNDEIMLLLSIINNFKHVIESKKTDSCTWKEKERAWQEIADKFNSVSPNLVRRSKEALKKCFENKKKETRKSKAEEKIQLLKTGGGSNPTEKEIDPVEKLTLAIMNEKTVLGSSNNFDCDSITNEEEFVVVPNETGILMELANLENFQEKVYSNAKEETSLYKKRNDDLKLVASSEYLQESVPEVNWSDYKPSHLQTPLHSKLKQIKTPKRPVTEDTSRRRPVSTTLYSNELSKQYSEVGNAKLELAQLQLNILKADTETRRQREAEEHKLKIEYLKLDILIKEATLKKIQTDTMSNFNFQRL